VIYSGIRAHIVKHRFMEVLEKTKILSGDQKMADVAALYELLFPHVAGFVKKKNGSFEEARDIFHDALVLYLQREEGQIETSAEAYIMGIVRHLWLRKYRADVRHVGVFGNDLVEADPDSVNDKKLLRFLKVAGKRCLDLLHAYYYENLSMRTIASDLQYGSERSATVQKYKCLEKIRDTIKSKSIAYDDFLE
jgi:DNA-directed RNA polymerase specialized sigma24 family protein